MPVLSHIETSQLIWKAHQLTGFYMRATLSFNGLNENIRSITCVCCKAHLKTVADLSLLIQAENAPKVCKFFY